MIDSPHIPEVEALDVVLDRLAERGPVVDERPARLPPECRQVVLARLPEDGRVVEELLGDAADVDAAV